MADDNPEQKFDVAMKAREIASDWAVFMDIDPNLFEVQVGDFDVASFDAKVDERHVYAGTFGNPDNTRFIIAIRPNVPPEQLEHIIVHELVHVYTFSNCGDDPRENMELATDQMAMLIQRLRKAEAA